MEKEEKFLKNIIDFENIHINYEVGQPVLENINLKINTNEHWAILGANGSGKSTLIKLISNDLHPNTGYPFRKQIFGKDRWSLFEIRKELGIITNDLHNYFGIHGKYATAYEVVLSGYYSSIGIFKYHDFTKKNSTKRF